MPLIGSDLGQTNSKSQKERATTPKDGKRVLYEHDVNLNQEVDPETTTNIRAFRKL